MLAALFLLTISSLVTASSAFDDPRELESLRVRMDFRGTATIVGTAESITVSVYKVPLGGNCTVPVKTDSDGRNYVGFSWEEPGNSASYSYSCTAETGRDNDPRISRDEPIPSKKLGNYTAQSELVSITPEIASKAQGLIDGVDEEFLAASILSSWVHDHMKYDKSYFGRVLNSKQIFEEMVGVCEEYSHLLLAMLRSVGIPSRYVTGFVYGQNGWDPHAWVEVYFPEQDVWLPFDPTYNENGYVDASHIRFFDSLDGSFAAVRTRFTYDALGQKPSIDWDDPSPKVTVYDELTGHELLKVNVSQDDLAVKMGEYAIVKAEVKNNAGTLLYPKLRLIYLAKTIGHNENLALAYGNDSMSFALAPNEKKNLYWVLQAKSRYTISPKVVAESTAFDAGNITGLDDTAGPNSELGLFSDRGGYGKNDIAKVTVTNKGRLDAVLTELTTGMSKTVSAGERTEFEIPARNGEAVVYSSTGELARISLPFYDSGLNARLLAPDKAIADRAFEVAISSSSNPALRITAAIGNQSFSGSGLLLFNHTLAESGVIAARVSAMNGGTEEVLRKYVEVLPAPEIFLSRITGSKPYLNVTVSVRNGLLSYASVQPGASSYYERLSGASGRLVFNDGSAKCGRQLRLQINTIGTDMLGQELTGTYDVYAEVRCGFLETLIQKFLDVFVSPFVR